MHHVPPNMAEISLHKRQRIRLNLLNYVIVLFLSNISCLQLCQMLYRGQLCELYIQILILDHEQSCPPPKFPIRFTPLMRGDMSPSPPTDLRQWYWIVSVFGSVCVCVCVCGVIEGSRCPAVIAGQQSSNGNRNMSQWYIAPADQRSLLFRLAVILSLSSRVRAPMPPCSSWDHPRDVTGHVVPRRMDHIAFNSNPPSDNSTRRRFMSATGKCCRSPTVRRCVGMDRVAAVRSRPRSVHSGRLDEHDDTVMWCRENRGTTQIIFNADRNRFLTIDNAS